MQAKWTLIALSFALTPWITACESDDPKDTPLPTATPDATPAPSPTAQPTPQASPQPTGDPTPSPNATPAPSPSPNACEVPAEYYPGDAWDACVSDEGVWRLAGPTTPSSAARTAAFESIADLLWRADGAPSMNAFVDAQLIYAEDGGLGSRVTRRYDSHIAPPAGSNCRDEDAGERWPEYCVGPAEIEPLLLDSFDAGTLGTEPRLNARRVEAALLWFLYVSAYKEANTCAGKAADCDSSWAYYSGGKQLDEPALGFGGEVQRVDADAHAAVYDGLYALRCWRDLDDAEVAEDDDLHNAALAQLDPALDRGLAVVLIDRIGVWRDADAAEKPEHWAFLEVLGPVIDRALRARDPIAAERFATILTDSASFIAPEAIAILEQTFPCPSTTAPQPPLICEAPEPFYPSDAWDACVSDEGVWRLAGPTTPSSAARTASFEAIGDLLWRVDGTPDMNAFVDAQVVYAEDGGLGSRVTRRYDSHIPEPEGANCRDEDAGEMWPEYCVGPAEIEPLLLDAFDAGTLGMEPRINARRVEAALVWFFYVSTYKEANTCAGKAADCDSTWAYYSGGKQLDEPSLGFGGLVQEIDADAHAAVFDGLLALRCWRDLDDAEVAEDADMHARALEQLDPALDRGLALLLVDRIEVWRDADAASKPEHWAFLEVLGPVIDRAASLRDAAKADQLAAMFNDSASMDAAAAIGILEGLFPCSY